MPAPSKRLRLSTTRWPTSVGSTDWEMSRPSAVRLSASRRRANPVRVVHGDPRVLGVVGGSERLAGCQDESARSLARPDQNALRRVRADTPPVLHADRVRSGLAQ